MKSKKKGSIPLPDDILEELKDTEDVFFNLTFFVEDNILVNYWSVKKF